MKEGLGWRVATFLSVSVWPVLWLYQAEQQLLGPDPGKALLSRFGLGALILLLLTLALTPLQRFGLWQGGRLIRRQLGLWCFTYSCLHLLAYWVFGLGFELGKLWTALSKQFYLTLGLLAWLVLLVLAITSNQLSKRYLGRTWGLVHRMLYPCLILVLVHQGLTVRSDWAEWGVYAGLGAFLLVLRWLPSRTQRP